MTQLPLFRETDPPTSREGADAIQPHLNLYQRRMLEAYRWPQTSESAAQYCAERFGGKAESYRKRTHELLRAGEIIEVGKQGRSRMFARCTK